MQVAERVELSLTKQCVEKLIICLGYDDADTFAANTRGAVALLVGQRVLQRCRPPPSDVHQPDVTRANARDHHGRPRTFYAAQERQLRRGRRGRGATLRNPQTWDTSPVVDFMGLWCDRLLLGDHNRPSRCALLEPHVPPLLWGTSIARVAQSHRHLTGADVLIVATSSSLPFGVVRLHSDLPVDVANTTTATPKNLAGTPSFPPLLHGTTSVDAAVKLFATPQRPSSCLQLGIGDAHGARSLLTTEEAAFADHLLVPLCAFTSALWTANPQRAAEYVASLTATPQTLTDALANQRLWETMQHAMLSTRDTALLRAYFNDEALDARFSPAQTHYFAETLLQRLREEELRR